MEKQKEEDNEKLANRVDQVQEIKESKEVTNGMEKSLERCQEMEKNHSSETLTIQKATKKYLTTSLT